MNRERSFAGRPGDGAAGFEKREIGGADVKERGNGSGYGTTVCDSPPKHLIKAAFTVEAALIMPVVLMVILSLVYLCMHVHNRNYLLSYAAEQSISGHEQPDPPLIFSTEVSAGRTDGGNMRTVSYKAGTVYYTGRRLYSIAEQAGYRKVKPVSYIWKMSAVKEIFGQG